MFKNENLETVIPSFEDLSFEEMRALQGAGEVQAETTPACAIAAAATAAESSAACGWAAGGVATGVGATFNN
jgi:type 2 lantibiotic (TIGR03893 family)